MAQLGHDLRISTHEIKPHSWIIYLYVTFKLLQLNVGIIFILFYFLKTVSILLYCMEVCMSLRHVCLSESILLGLNVFSSDIHLPHNLFSYFRSFFIKC